VKKRVRRGAMTTFFVFSLSLIGAVCFPLTWWSVGNGFTCGFFLAVLIWEA
jgi:hypothetical protein